MGEPTQYPPLLHFRIFLTCVQVDDPEDDADDAVLDTESTRSLRLVKALLIEAAC